MAHRFGFITFANLVGTLEFDNDACYDACEGVVELRNGPDADDLLLYQAFYSPMMRDMAMQEAFKLASAEMEKSANRFVGF